MLQHMLLYLLCMLCIAIIIISIDGVSEGAAEHPFFGSRRSVVEELRSLPGFDSGLVSRRDFWEPPI